MFTTLTEMMIYCQENGVRMADFMMIDLNGRWRHLTMPIGRLTEDTLKDGIGFDGSNYGFAPVEFSDMVLIPDLSSAYLEAFCEVPTLAMIGAPRTMIKTVINASADMEERASTRKSRPGIFSLNFLILL